jgi:autotransporter strand-loop-strand O-heptosyltransferase
MKIVQVHLGLLPIPPNGWGAVEKIIWEYHQNLNSMGMPCEIKYLNDIQYTDDTIVHVHVANLANECHIRGIPYIFTIHDHHVYLYGKNSNVFEENLKAIENSVISTCPSKYLVDYFESKKLRYFSHAVNTDQFTYKNFEKPNNKLLCVANNGYANNQSSDRKGFKYAIQAAMELDYPITIAGPSNNKKFFETLDDELNNYSKLTKVFDLTEDELIELYNKHSIFIHASELEAGHPNLTILEAMSCGLPVIGTFEQKSYDGMVVVDRDVKQIVDAVNTVSSNYSEYQSYALKSSTTNSYKNRINELINLYDEYTEKLFAKKFIDIYNNTHKTHREVKTSAEFKLHFNDRATVEIENLFDENSYFNVTFADKSTNDVKYSCDIKHGWWTSCNFNYYIPFNIKIKDKNGEVVYNHDLNLENKNVLIEYDSFALGDQLAWMPIIEQFRKKHKCNLFVKLPLNHLFEKKYPHINFINDLNGINMYATYKLGWYVDNNGYNKDRHKNDPRKLPLQKIASDYLGLDYIPERPILDYEVLPRPVDKKYVAIATQSTAQAKYWNNTGGWKKVIEYLNSIGYEVICIDKNKSYGSYPDYMNDMPDNALDFTGDKPLNERISQIHHCDFFIGLPSGLSWLAWSVGVPTVLISGFSYPYTEFKTPYRVQNHDVCTGCWNDELFDKGNWKWCPKPNKKELFECTKSITPEMVIKVINRLIKDNKL